MKDTIFYLSLFLLLFSSCNKEDVQVSTEGQPAQAEGKALLDDCEFNANTNRVRLFEICSSELMIQGSLRLVNAGDIHYIQASGKCHKLGDPDHLIDAQEIKIDVFGSAHIWCDIPLDITIPSDYNKNLVGGEVPTHVSCNGCAVESTTIEYWKTITKTDLDEIKADIHFWVSYCGEHYIETISLEL